MSEGAWLIYVLYCLTNSSSSSLLLTLTVHSWKLHIKLHTVRKRITSGGPLGSPSPAWASCCTLLARKPGTRFSTYCHGSVYTVKINELPCKKLYFFFDRVYVYTVYWAFWTKLYNHLKCKSSLRVYIVHFQKKKITPRSSLSYRQGTKALCNRENNSSLKKALNVALFRDGFDEFLPCRASGLHTRWIRTQTKLLQ